MNVRKVLAGSLAAITAGATLALGVFGAGLGDYVSVSANALTSPIIVIGDPAQPSAAFAKDVLGAADIAAAVAGYATTTVTVGGGAVVAVSNGVDLATAATKLYLQDPINNAKSTLTKSDLPTVLASGSVTDEAGTEYKFDQYIRIGTSTATMGDSGGDIDEPTLYVNVGTDAAVPVYTAQVVFSKALNISNTEVQSQKMTLLGNEYTIGSESTNTKLVLYGGAQKNTIAEGETASISVEGVDHTVRVIGVSSSTEGVVEIDGVSKEVVEGRQYTISGSKGKIDVYVDAVWFFQKEGQISSIRLSLGSSKLTLEDGNEVKRGTEDESVDNTLVTITGAPLSKLEVAIAAQDSETDHVAEGSPYTDPIFGTFKVAFGGLTPGVDDVGRDTIEVKVTGDEDAQVMVTDYRANKKTITFAHDADDVSTTVTPILSDSNAYNYTVVEGEATKKKEYVLISQGDFSHILEVKTISSITDTNAKVEFEDVFDGSTITVNLVSPTYTNASFYVDGQEYFVNATSEQVEVTWGNGASAGVTGVTTLFPLIGANNGEDFTFVCNMSRGSAIQLANGTYEVPGGSAGTSVVEYDDNAHAFNASTGRLTYAFNANEEIVTVGAGTSLAAVDSPVLLVLEEKGKDSTGAEVRDAIIVESTFEGTAKMAIGTSPKMTGANTGFTSSTADSDIKMAMDRYGVLVTVDSEDQNKVTLAYPDEQAFVNVAIGSNPQFSVAGVAATVETAVKITSPVSKLASEVNTATLAADLILIGGPCANTLVGQLADAGNFDTCAAWTYSTGIIKEVEDAFVSGKKALVVAGTTADDTRSLAAQVMRGTLSFEA